MTTDEFDPDIPVGEPTGPQPQQRFVAGRPLPSAGEFDPDIPFGVPTAPTAPAPQHFFGPATEPAPMAVFDPNATADGLSARKGSGPQPGPLSFRCAARLIDGVLCVLVTSVLTGSLQDTEFLIQWIILGIVTLAYFTLFEAILGWTPGKKIFGLSVHANDRSAAGNPSLKQAFVRNRFLWWLMIPYAGIIIVILPCLVIAYSIAKSPTKQGKHDLRAEGTQVLRG